MVYPRKNGWKIKAILVYIQLLAVIETTGTLSVHYSITSAQTVKQTLLEVVQISSYVQFDVPTPLPRKPTQNRLLFLRS